MKVNDAMTKDGKSCRSETNLAAAAMMMWDTDCGILPVVDQAGRVIGVVTDRDITMAVATKPRLASDITVQEVLSGRLFSCSREDDVKGALAIMATERIRRLPVLDSGGQLEGMLSINDLILQAEPGRPDLSDQDVVNALKAICGHRALVGA